MVVMASIMVEKGVVVDAIIFRPTAVENENNDFSSDLIPGSYFRCDGQSMHAISIWEDSNSKYLDRVPGGSQR